MLELGIMAEDNSDIDTLVALARRITDADFHVKRYATKGCGRLKIKCKTIVETWMGSDNAHIVICHDLDSGDANSHKRLKEELEAKIRPILKRQPNRICIVIPVQEIEAWFLADVEPLKKKFKSIKVREASHPENIEDPKEYIKRICRKCKSPYIHNRHNPELARELDIDKVLSKCPAFVRSTLSYRSFRRSEAMAPPEGSDDAGRF